VVEELMVVQDVQEVLEVVCQELILEVQVIHHQ
jgi:hypothetical protein